MRVVLSTPLVLDRLNRGTRPYNFLFCPLIDAVVGYPRGVDRAQFSLVAPFTKNREAWLTLPCVNMCDGTSQGNQLFDNKSFACLFQNSSKRFVSRVTASMIFTSLQSHASRGPARMTFGFSRRLQKLTGQSC